MGIVRLYILGLVLHMSLHRCMCRLYILHWLLLVIGEVTYLLFGLYGLGQVIIGIYRICANPLLFSRHLALS